ncbi:MAG: BON domain-containing protein [Flavobacteriales bacterium]|nr:BON domain-containing protein [Flavobacteriales bacterium]
MNDNRLHTKIINKLNSEPTLSHTQITISIKKNEIVLKGKVGTYCEEALANAVVKRVETEKAINNKLKVVPFLFYKRSDVEIEKAAIHALHWAFLIPEEEIKIMVEEGHITIYGNVKHNEQKQRAKEAIKDLFGIIAIHNHIKVQRFPKI